MIDIQCSQNQYTVLSTVSIITLPTVSPLYVEQIMKSCHLVVDLNKKSAEKRGDECSPKISSCVLMVVDCTLHSVIYSPLNRLQQSHLFITTHPRRKALFTGLILMMTIILFSTKPLTQLNITQFLENFSCATKDFLSGD